VLRIDLLPGHFAAARAAKTLLVLMVIALLVVILACFGFLTMRKSVLATRIQERDEAKRKADEVRAIEAKAQEKENLAAPIDSKVRFIEDADGCGEQWWAAYEKVNRYIYAQAQLTTIRIQAPSSVHFEVNLPDTTSVGRFVLNLIRCPDISNIRVGGAPPGGPGVGPNAQGGGGGGGGGMAPAMGGGMPAPGGVPMAGAGPEMGMMGGMGGMGGGAPAAASSAGGPIHLSIDASLTQPLSTPAPGGGAAAAAGGAPGMMGAGGPGGGMPGGGMPGMGGGMPGGGGPPGAGPPGGGPPGGGPKGGAPKGGGGEGGSEGGGLKGRDAGGGDE